MTRKSTPKTVETINHDDTRKNIPTAEMQSVAEKGDAAPVTLKYNRNTDLDPQLMWRGKDQQDLQPLTVQASPLYIQEKIHPRALINDLMKQTQERTEQQPAFMPDLFSDFNGVPEGAKAEFYQHEQHWSNRMILGDSLQVMASLAEREGLRGKVQCIYFDPPYGIKFNSNFQWSTTTRDVKDGNSSHITREPEQVKAFRDTWRDGIHSYLGYIRDRLIVSRDLLSESGSIFIQIGDENVHRIRAVMDEIFGAENFISQIVFEKTSSTSSDAIGSVTDHIIWFSKSRKDVKIRVPYKTKALGEEGTTQYTSYEEMPNISRRLKENELSEKNLRLEISKVFAFSPLTSQRPIQEGDLRSFIFQGKTFEARKGTFKTNKSGLTRLSKSGRLRSIGKNLMYQRYLLDFSVAPISNYWNDVKMTGFSEDKLYVVQTGQKVIARCILMTTDPSDLVLDPTCGSGTTAYVAEQWGRRWITIDTSRVALALARARLMGARYPFYLLADSLEGQMKEAEITRSAPKSASTRNSIRQGFVYERVPHITLKSIANNAEIDVIWEKWQTELEPIRAELVALRAKNMEEWEIPRDAADAWEEAAVRLHGRILAAKENQKITNKTAQDLSALNALLKRSYTLENLPEQPADSWPADHAAVLAQWWEKRIARQKEIDASIAAKADSEFLYDRPYVDSKKVRVAGPFTVESLSPHRMLALDANGELKDPASEPEVQAIQSFTDMILEQLKTAGVQQVDKAARISFDALKPWPGKYVHAEGRYEEDEGQQRRAAICIGPEFGTMQRKDIVLAAREAADADFDILIVCAFNFEAHATEFNSLGNMPVLKARMNADLHMGGDLKPTGAGNLFVVFGEPDIEIQDVPGEQIRVKVNGVDVFDPAKGEVRSDDVDGIACWFIDTNYDSESFFVRQAYFLGANDPYGALKTTLKAEIDEQAWETLNSDISQPFDKPQTGHIAVKVINHLGDEVMKVFGVD
ncbi:site-specific DNA-methyltransferase [uncultured Deinococcus sp.]|uniref:site-specific DNA-methyltransferase n=1 Tax=uncultured Deinococcus sp. TaxID=158789 RepID=UPI00258B5ED1|nr:site-specific DNA-methyltransferase [uncultured Deinococcus sp.]